MANSVKPNNTFIGIPRDVLVKALLDSSDGVENFQHLLDDEGPQVIKPLNRLPHKLQHVGGSSFVSVAQEFHQLRRIPTCKLFTISYINAEIRLWRTENLLQV